MITVDVFKTKAGYSGFTVSGHALFADEGKDIVCAGVSVLVINAVNSIEALSGDREDVTEEDGFVSVRFPSVLSEKGTLLMDSLLLGLRDIEKSYGKQFLKVHIREV